MENHRHYIDNFVNGLDHDVESNLGQSQTPQTSGNTQTQYNIFQLADQTFDSQYLQQLTNYMSHSWDPSLPNIPLFNGVSWNLPPLPSNTLQYIWSNFPPPANFLYQRDISSHPGIRARKLCTFCRKNGEAQSFYLTHCVKEKINYDFIVTCPVLRALKCRVCKATGDVAHTISYCPVVVAMNNGRRNKGLPVLLHSTPYKSNGKRRY